MTKVTMPVLADALEYVMYCDEIRFLPDNVQELVSKAIDAAEKES